MEIERYSRHLIIPEISISGQRKIKDSKVLCIGAGGLGSPVAMYLAAAGVGRIGLLDFDTVDVTNLQRQIIHGTKDLGKSKILSAKESIVDINPHVQVDLHEFSLNSENALTSVQPYDIIIDGTDNFSTRYLVNDACVLAGKPNVYGSVFRFEGQASVFCAKDGPCYRCLYPEPPPPGLMPNCAEGGVLGVLPGIIGLLQATEALKLILGIGKPLIGRLKLFDALGMNFKELPLRKDPSCPACGEKRSINQLADYENLCGPKNTEEVPLGPQDSITVTHLSEQVDQGHRFFILDVRESHEFEICHIAGATLIPLQNLPRRLGELDKSLDIIVYCKTGVRGGKAVKLLRESGFSRVRNLKGGILEWSVKIDHSVPRY